LEFFENNFNIRPAWDVHALQPQHVGSAPRGTPLNLGSLHSTLQIRPSLSHNEAMAWPEELNSGN